MISTLKTEDFAFCTLNFLERLVKSYIKGGYLTQKLSQLFIIALFGSIIFVVNVFLPPPLNYALMVVEAVLLALSGLFIRKVGAIYVGAVGGLLTALGNPALGPFTFFFSLLFGMLVDLFLFIFRINASREGVNRNRLMGCDGVEYDVDWNSELLCLCNVSAILTCRSMAYSFKEVTMLDALVLFMGPATAVWLAYAASYLWNKYLRHILV